MKKNISMFEKSAPKIPKKVRVKICKSARGLLLPASKSNSGWAKHESR
jgi:ribosomal protein L31E